MPVDSVSVQHVGVPGGDLAVEVRAGATAPVLLVHGISSTRRLWDWLAEQAPDLSLLAPDLRGRGDSIGVVGDSSVQQHADDMLRVLDALGLDHAVVCGMSMGGFVAVDLAVRHPERVRSLVLVDGGFPMTGRPSPTREELPERFASRLERLDQTWSSLREYAVFFASTTTRLLDCDDPLLLGYLAHDLDATGRVRLSARALLEDAASVFLDPGRWQELTVPVRFTHAEWSRGPGTPPAYPASAVAQYAAIAVDVRPLPGLDHAGAIMSPQGARVTAELLRDALVSTS